MDGLGEIEAIEISKVFVVMIVTITPGVVGVVLINAEDFTHDDVHFERCEKIAMSHVVELHEDAEGVAPMNEPSEISESQCDQRPCHNFPHYGNAYGNPGSLVIGFTVAPDVVLRFDDARILLLLWLDHSINLIILPFNIRFKVGWDFSYRNKITS